MKDTSIEALIENDTHRATSMQEVEKQVLNSHSDTNNDIFLTKEYSHLYRALLSCLSHKFLFLIPSPQFQKALAISGKLALKNDFFYYVNFLIHEIQNEPEEGIFQIIKANGYFQYLGAINALKTGLFNLAGNILMKCYAFFIKTTRNDLQIDLENYQRWKRDADFHEKYNDLLLSQFKKSVKTDFFKLYYDHCKEWQTQNINENHNTIDPQFFNLKSDILNKAMFCYKKMKMPSTYSLVQNKALVLNLKYGKLEDAVNLCADKLDLREKIEKVIAGESIQIEPWNLEDNLLKKEQEKRKNGEYDLL